MQKHTQLFSLSKHLLFLAKAILGINFHFIVLSVSTV